MSKQALPETGDGSAVFAHQSVWFSFSEFRFCKSTEKDARPDVWATEDRNFRLDVKLRYKLRPQRRAKPLGF